MDTNLAQGNGLTQQIIAMAARVHRALGPGLLESAYQTCLCHELTSAGVAFKRQAALTVMYDGVRLDCGFIADMIVESSVLLALKSVECLMPLHEAQLLTYLRLSPCNVGLLINFNTVSLSDGIRHCML